MAFLCSALISRGHLTGEGRKQAFVCGLGERVRHSRWAPSLPGKFRALSSSQRPLPADGWGWAVPRKKSSADLKPV